MSEAVRGPSKFWGDCRVLDACAEPGCPVWRCLRADSVRYLDGLLYEHVNDPGTRARLSWRLALEVLAGAPGVFGNDVHGPAAREAAGPRAAALRTENEALRRELDALRAALTTRTEGR